MKKILKKLAAWFSKVREDIKEKPWAYALCLISIGVFIAIFVLNLAGVVPDYVYWTIFLAVMSFYAGDCFGQMVSKK